MVDMVAKKQARSEAAQESEGAVEGGRKVQLRTMKKTEEEEEENDNEQGEEMKTRVRGKQKR